MGSERIFVGRKADLERFRDILKDTRGQAVVVVGAAGMGKTWLVEEMAEAGVSGERYAVRREREKWVASCVIACILGQDLADKVMVFE